MVKIDGNDPEHDAVGICIQALNNLGSENAQNRVVRILAEYHPESVKEKIECKIASLQKVGDETWAFEMCANNIELTVSMSFSDLISLRDAFIEEINNEMKKLN